MANQSNKYMANHFEKLSRKADTGFPKIHEVLRDCNACIASSGLEHCTGQKAIQWRGVH